MRRRQLIACVAVALAVPLSACGDDDGGGGNLASNDETVIAKADFIQAANAACERRGDQITAQTQRVFEKYSDQPESPKARKELVSEVIVPGFEAQARDLRALEPPPGEEDEVEEVISTIEEMVERTREDFAEGRDYPYRKTENVAAAYGLPACGHP
jgi:hypothetical protein